MSVTLSPIYWLYSAAFVVNCTSWNLLRMVVSIYKVIIYTYIRSSSWAVNWLGYGICFHPRWVLRFLCNQFSVLCRLISTRLYPTSLFYACIFWMVKKQEIFCCYKAYVVFLTSFYNGIVTEYSLCSLEFAHIFAKGYHIKKKIVLASKGQS